MTVTVNTDASVRLGGFGGWAFWIVSEKGKIQSSGPINRRVHDSTCAELAAIANALHAIKKHKWPFRLEKVYIKTDSKNAITALQNAIRHSCGEEMAPYVEAVFFLMMEICIKEGVKPKNYKTLFDFRHVKAHTSNKNSRSYVNNWCDEQAKIHSRALKLNHLTN